MDAGEVLSIKGAIEKRLIFEIAEACKHIDVAKYPHVRFTLEFLFDDLGLVDATVETRYRRRPKSRRDQNGDK